MPIPTTHPTALTDTGTTPNERLGTPRTEVDSTYGARDFLYCFNISASTIAEGESAMLEGAGTEVTLSDGSVSKAIRSSGSFITDGVKVGDLIVCTDDAGAAGAAPEQEYSIVTGVTALQIDFSPELTVALVSGDKVNFFRRSSVKTAADACGAPEYAGIAMAAVVTLGYGWFQVAGIHPAAKVKASTAYAEGALMKPGAGVLDVVTDTEDSGEAVAVVLVGIQSDAVRNRTVVRLFGPSR